MSFCRLSLITFPLVAGLALLTGACGAPLVVTGASYAADGGMLAASNKTATDHLASMMSKKDCALWRVIRSRPVCKEREGDKDPYAVDYTQPQRTVSEDGVQYGPPLHAAPDAPAASWDAAAYKATLPAPSVPFQPVTAVADAAPDPVVGSAVGPTTAPAAANQAAPKPRKPKVRSVKKPARGPAAPAS
jgi:hypothetical protein